ncbi:MAG: helix-turn-helix domain containing protein [Rhodobacteraceae bacterium]|nr:helix-turn-helix domain containing protein [Paracoccaceae bacterium]
MHDLLTFFQQSTTTNLEQNFFLDNQVNCACLSGGMVGADSGEFSKRIIMMDTTGRKIYIVYLTEDENQSLQDRVKSCKGSAQSRDRAQILLLANANRPIGRYYDKYIADIVGVSTSTVERVRKKCVLEGIEATVGW